MKKQNQQTKWGRILLYNILVVLLALASFALVVLAVTNIITLKHGVYRIIFSLIWIFFLIDY
ncbi:MAG: ion transporter, partial [Lentilactobacillus hilgardii]